MASVEAEAEAVSELVQPLSRLLLFHLCLLPFVLHHVDRVPPLAFDVDRVRVALLVFPCYRR